MNLFFKSYRIYFIFFLFITCQTSAFSGTQGNTPRYCTPRILSYDLPNSLLRSPNVSLVRDAEGRLFLGKTNGIFALDGSSVHHLPLNGPVHLARTTGGTLFYLAANDFGKIYYNPYTGLRKESLVHTIQTPYNFFRPRQLAALGETLFMATSEGVFVYTEQKPLHFLFNRAPVKLFKSGNRIFISAKKEGLFHWDQNTFKMVLPPEATGKVEICGIAEGDDLARIFLSDGSCIKLSGFEKEIYRRERSQWTDKQLSQVEQVSDSLFLWSTGDHKLFIVNARKEVVTELTGSGHIPGNSLRTLVQNDEHSYWMLFDFNLLKLEYPSVSYTLEFRSQHTGRPLNATMSGDRLFLGTTRGLFCITPQGEKSWSLSDNYAGNGEYIHLFDTIGGALFAAGNKNLYRIEGDNQYRIDRGSYHCLKATGKNTLFASTQEGFSRYQYSGSSWRKRIINPEIIYAHSLLTHDDKIWFIDNGKTLFTCNLQGKELKEISTPGTTPLQGLIVINDHLFLRDKNRIWTRVDAEKRKFEAYAGNIPVSEIMDADFVKLSGQNLWVIYNHSSSVCIKTFHPDKGFSPYCSFTQSNDLKRITGIDQADSMLWITGQEKLVRIHLDQIPTHHTEAIRIEKVLSAPSGKSGPKKIPQPVRPGKTLDYSSNSVSFYLADKSFQLDPETIYRYRLSNVQEEWSDWSEQPVIRFPNLKENTYRFEAQSRSMFGHMSEPVQFGFSINPPVYRTWYAYTLYILLLAMVLFLLHKWRLLNMRKVETRAEARIKDKMDLLVREKEESERLVADIFPKVTANELKTRGRAKWEKYEMATVLFSDIQGFTRIAEEMNPELLIDELDKFFFHFDSVVDKYNIEKIKTIGDAYMAAGGIPEKNNTNPVEVVLAALEMQNYMQDLKKTKADIWDLRIGIHTGPVIAGVVGHKKLSYDIWGDTVNTASRMESSGTAGKVNISGITYSMVKEYFLCEYRGKLPVKYKGNIDMYYVTGLRPELSIDLKGIPNRRFFLKIQLLRLSDVEDKIFSELLSDLPDDLHFHTISHMRRVYRHTELLCRSENIAEEDTLLTITASLFMFTGIIHNYDNFENRSVVIAREMLPHFKYTDKQIDTITNLILAVKYPFDPQNKLEKILIDARMEYLGRPDYVRMFKLLFMELRSRKPEITPSRLKQEQVSLLEDFSFFTRGAQRLREISGLEQIRRLEAEEHL